MERSTHRLGCSLSIALVFILISWLAMAIVDLPDRWPGSVHAAATYDWPTLAHDLRRSGATAVGPVGPYTKQWYRDFWSELGEQVSDGYQPVIVHDTVHNLELVYVGTTDGALYALDLRTGATYWRYPAGGGHIGGILSPPTIANSVVYLATL